MPKISIYTYNDEGIDKLWFLDDNNNHLHKINISYVQLYELKKCTTGKVDEILMNLICEDITILIK